MSSLRVLAEHWTLVTKGGCTVTWSWRGLALAGAIIFLSVQGATASHTGLLFGAPNRVVVTLSEYKFTPSTITIEAGAAVDLVLENKGSLSHYFSVYPKPLSPFKSIGDWHEYLLAKSYLQGMGEIVIHQRNADSYTVGGQITEIGVDPGKKVTLTFTPSKKGTFEFGCHLPTGGANHYTAGMRGVLVVK